MSEPGGQAPREPALAWWREHAEREEHVVAKADGRLARFLMNVALLGEGLPWVTIRNDDRPRYVSALHAAQVDGDVLPFARFVLAYVQNAVAAFEA